MKLDVEIIVVGAGAAGLWAAARAAELLGKAGKVLLLEKTARAGAKILASGGTRCNLTTTLGFGDSDGCGHGVLRGRLVVAISAASPRFWQPCA